VLVGLAALVVLAFFALRPGDQTVPSAWRPTGGLNAMANPVGAGALQGQAVPVGQSQDRGQAMDGYLTDLMGSGRFSGAVLVAQGGQVLLSKGYGLADTMQVAPNTPQTRFRLASMSKQFTAVAILILQAQGRLNLNDPACTYLPSCPDAWGPITIRHLLTHSSGLPNYTDFAGFDGSAGQATTPDELISRFRDMPLRFAPGSAFSYGNSGYVLLGRIIEQVSGQSYGDFLRTAIFEPLGMNDSGYDDGSVARAVSYSRIGQIAFGINTTTLFAAGGLYSSVDDLYKWDQALYSDRLLPANLRNEMFTPAMQNYGYGWFIQQRSGRRVIYHPGWISGAATYSAHLPDQGLTVIVLSNLETANVQGISDQLIELALR
jgi:CubicO group peptidase (beta-lactamase class C family)